MRERNLALERETNPNTKLLPEQTINSFSLELVFRFFTVNDFASYISVV
jgi:hypothetical protein